MKKIIFILTIFSLILNVSCVTDETCTQTKYVKLTVGFYHVKDTLDVRTFTPFGVDSMTVQGLRIDTTTNQYHLVDSILYNNDKTKLTSINLPLDNFATQSVFRIKFNAIIDTMTIRHANLNDYLSLECGCIVTHSIDTVIVTNHYIDSVRVFIHNVNTLNAENIRLYK